MLTSEFAAVNSVNETPGAVPDFLAKGGSLPLVVNVELVSWVFI